MEEKKSRGTGAVTAFFVILSIVLMAGCGFIGYKYLEISKELGQHDKENEAAVAALQQEVEESDGTKLKKKIQESLENGETPLKMLRDIYSDHVVYSYGGKFYFAPINKNVPLNDFNADDFQRNDKGELEYIKEGKTASYKGIDVSKYQGSIDWKAVAEDGVDYAIIRIGYRGYGTGEIVLDEAFENNVKGALDAGLDVGVYFFSQAIDEKEAAEEAKFVLDNIKAYKINGPVVFDTEEVASGEGRMKDISSDKLTDITIKFMETVKKKGYTPMIYANLQWFVSNLDISRLGNYEKWFASYTTPFYFPYEISMWQYSDAGSVNGIKGNVDMNISFKKWKG
ncbi:glycoside hydrolase family 25 protein [Lachnospiraceae bacterium HCP1S3_C3]